MPQFVFLRQQLYKLTVRKFMFWNIINNIIFQFEYHTVPIKTFLVPAGTKIFAR